MEPRVIYGDALESLSHLPAHSVDAIVTDPPYCSGGFSEAGRQSAKGQGLRSETIRADGWFTGDNMGTAGLLFLLRSVALEGLRIARPSGSLLVFLDWRMYPNVVPALESAGLRYQNLVVWDKGSLGLGTGFRPQHELIAHFTFGAPKYYAVNESNVIRCKRVPPHYRDHPTQKPVELMERLLSVVCPKGGTVLDPFCGSGSTGVAAKKLGMNFIGVERDRSYTEVTVKRLDAAEVGTQQHLFSTAHEFNEGVTKDGEEA